MMDQVLGLYNYWIVIFLMMTGFYIVIAKGNLIKTVIGLNIFQTSVFLLYITMGKIHAPGATAPILPPGTEVHHEESHGHEAEHAATSTGHAIQAGLDQSGTTDTAHDLAQDAAHETAHEAAHEGAQAVGHGAEEIIYSNPLPSVLMLTAIVVGIATTALALALIVRIREEYGTIEESEILELDRNS